MIRDGWPVGEESPVDESGIKSRSADSGREKCRIQALAGWGGGGAAGESKAALTS